MQSWNYWFTHQYSQLGQIRVRRARTEYNPKLFIGSSNSYLNLISNDYLGLANHPTLKTALYQASEIFDV